MQCNIDARGKRVRLMAGIGTVMLALVVLCAVIIAGWTDWWVWLIIGVFAFAGGFAIFEARAGWCAVRALGFKTPV